MELFKTLFNHFEDLRVLFFSDLLQSSLTTFSGLALVGVRLKLREVLAVGIPLGLYLYLERALMFTFQYSPSNHILLGALGLILAGWIILRLPIVTTVTATAISYIIILSSEPLFLMPMVNYLKIDLKLLQANTWPNVALGLFSNIPLLVFGGLAYFSRVSLLRLSGGRRDELIKISEVGFRNNLLKN